MADPAKLYNERQFQHLDSGAILQYSFAGASSGGEDIISDIRSRVAAFCTIDDHLYIVACPPPPTPSCNPDKCLRVHMMEVRQTRQGATCQQESVLLLTEPSKITVFSTPNIAVIKLRDQETEEEIRLLMEGMGKRLYAKAIDVLRGDEAPRYGLDVFTGDTDGLGGVCVQSTQSGMCYGEIIGLDRGKKTLTVGPKGLTAVIHNDNNRGALVMSMEVNQKGRLVAYGLVVGSSESTATVYLLKDALDELRRTRFPGKAIILCSPKSP